jgi:hypothetical protein
VQSADPVIPAYELTGPANQFISGTLHLACPLAMSVGGKRSLATTSMLAAGGSKCDLAGAGAAPVVHVIDQHATQDVGCTLYVLGQGNAVAASFTVMSSGESPSRQFLTFATPRMDFTGKTLFAVCVVPPHFNDKRSRVVSFAVSSCDL